MGIRLKAPAPPAWVDLGNGVALLASAVTAQTVHIARSRADALLIDLAAGAAAVTRLGGRIEGGFDADDIDAVEGVRQTLVVVSIAELVVSDWRGVLDDDGAPLSFQPALLALLLSDQRVFEPFSRQCLGPIHEVVAEGNV